MAKTMKKFRAAALNCDKHNKREKQLSHTRPELQPKDPKEWMWEAPDKKSVYLMRKQAEKEYHAVEVIAHGKHGDYITYKSLPKNSEPVKEAVVRVKRDTTVADVKRWTDLMEQKYGIRAVGIYLHMDEGHWATLKEGQTEDMYRRTDGKEWKRLNEFGEWEYWKSNYHAHVDFDWFDHKKGRCISLGKKVMSDMEDDLAQILGMERGTPKAISGVQGIDTWDYKDKMEKERLAEKYERGKEKIREQQNTITNLEGEIATRQKKLDDQNLDYRRTDIKVKGLSKMLENLTIRKNDLFAEIRQLEEDANNGRISVDELQQKAQQLHQQLEETEQKIKDKKEKLDKATEQLDMILDQKADARHKYDDLQRAINRDKPTLEGRVIRDFQALGWQIAVTDTKATLEKLDDYSRSLSQRPMAQYQFDQAAEMAFTGNILGEMAIRGSEIAAVAGALYLGLVDNAVEFSQTHGGGGSSPDDDWGRKPGEDDEAFRMRCFGMARLMMRPAGRSQQQSRGPKR